MTNPTERLRFVPRYDRKAHDLAPCVWRVMQAADRYNEVYNLIPKAAERWDGRHASLRAPSYDPNDLHIDFEAGKPSEDTRRLTMLSSETVHHLRTALDYLAFQTLLLDHGSPHEQSQFVLAPDRPTFRKQMKHRMPRISMKHHDWVEAVQPFNGVEWTQVLVDLSNRDKHRFAIDVVPAYTFSYDPTVKFADPEGDPKFIGYQVEKPDLSFLISDTLAPNGSSREVSGALSSMLTGVTTLLNLFLTEVGQDAVTIDSTPATDSEEDPRQSP